MAVELVPKGLKQILEEDSSLSEKVTYEEFIQGKTIPQNSDISIEEAYAEYLKIKSGE